MHFALRLGRCLLVAICQLRPKFARAENPQAAPSQTKPDKLNNWNNCCYKKLILAGWVKIRVAAAEEEAVVEEEEAEGAAAM